MNSDIVSRIDQVKDSFRRLSIYQDMLKKQQVDAENKERELRYHIELRQKESEILKSWLDDSIHKNIDSISELSTTGLQHVIKDQNISFHIKTEPKNNKLHMKFIIEHDGNEGDPLKSFGGGAAVVISLIMRIAVMARMNMSNLLILDESLAALADIYVPSCGSFMRQLSEQTGVNILMVTHNREFLNHAHVSYEGYKDETLKLKRLRMVSE